MMRDDIAFTKKLLATRLQWYAKCTGRLVTRNWQWFVLALALVPFPQVLTIVGYPLVTLLDPTLTIPVRLGVLALLSFLIALWVYPQRQQILGSKFEPFLNTLPIGHVQRVIVDITTLSVAISLILVPAFIARFTSDDVIPRSVTWQWIAMLAVISALLLVGYSVLHRRRSLIVATLLTIVLLAFALGMPDDLSLLLVLLLALVCTVLVFPIRGKHQESSARIYLRPIGDTGTVRFEPSHWVAITLPWRVVRENISPVTLRLVVTGTFTLFAVSIQSAFNYDSRALNVGVGTVAMNAFMLGGISRHFQEARIASRSYISTLPMRKRNGIIMDLACLCLLAAPFTGAITVSLVNNNVMSGTSSIFLAVLQFPLIASLHQVVTRVDRQSVLVCSLLVVFWVWAILVIIK